MNDMTSLYYTLSEHLLQTHESILLSSLHVFHFCIIAWLFLCVCFFLHIFYCIVGKSCLFWLTNKISEFELQFKVRFHLRGAVAGRIWNSDRRRLPPAVVRFDCGGSAVGPSRMRRGSSSTGGFYQFTFKCINSKLLAYYNNYRTINMKWVSPHEHLYIIFLNFLYNWVSCHTHSRGHAGFQEPRM